jgi:hypothetical protein
MDRQGNSSRVAVKLKTPPLNFGLASAGLGNFRDRYYKYTGDINSWARVCRRGSVEQMSI